jgi:hypothetical protein
MRLLTTLLLLFPASAGAEPVPTCVRKTAEDAYREPASLKALRACHKKTFERFTADYEVRHGDLPPDEIVEAWQEAQRAEVRDFMERHPHRSVTEGESRGRVQGTDGAALRDLGEDLWKSSEEGRKGITPEMAADILNFITDQQGSVSREMSNLLIAVQRDGAQLTEDTVRQLKAASRKAAAAGLDLGVDEQTKDFLLKEESKSKKAGPRPAEPAAAD